MPDHPDLVEPAPGPAEDDTQPTTHTTPPVDPPAADADDEPPAPEWGNWLYTGHGERTYTQIPVTVTAGDVIHHHGIPATDGAWQPTDEPVNRLPDNHRDDPADAEAATPTGQEG